MTLSAGTVSIGVKPDTKGFGASLHSGILGASSGIGATGKILGGMVLGGVAAGMAGIAAIVHTGLGEMLDASAGSAQLAAGIKSTGNAAHVSVDGMNSLASSIQGMSGQTDDSIVASEKLLLTFTGIKNVGPNKIFDQATQATADMAAKMGGDASGAAIQLGKALNDPVKGISSLSRVGVAFTKAQKDSIAAMVKHGDTMGAQKVILKELQTEFGGAAKAAGESLPGQLARGKRAFEDMSQSVVTTILPIVLPAITSLASGITKAMPQVQKFAEVFAKDLAGAIKLVSPILSGLWTSVIAPFGKFLSGTAVPAIRDFFSGFTQGTDKIGSAQSKFAVFGAVLSEKVLPAFNAVKTFILTQVVPAFMRIVTAVQGFVAVALPIVQAFVAGMMARIRPMMPTIKTIFGQIGSIIVGAMGLIQAVISRVTSVISFIWSHWGTSIMNFAAAIWSGMLKIISGALKVIQGIIKTVTSLIKGDWSGVWSGIKQILSGVWDTIKGIISLALTYIKGLLSAAWELIKTGVSTAWGKITALISTAWSGIKTAVATKTGELLTFVAGIPAKILTGLGDLAKLLLQKGTDVVQGFWDGMTAVWTKITAWVSSIAGWIKDHKGPLSLDQKLLTPAGTAIMEGFHKGLVSGFEKVKASVTAMTGSIAGGASQWVPIIQQVLTELGQPLSLTAAVTRLIMKESGGDPKIVNNWDSNARAGHPSGGLIQTIQSTFDSFAGPYRALGMFNPKANLYAGLRHAISAWGSIAAVDPLHHMGGYADGTSSAAPGYAWVGERGPEMVRFRGGEQVIPTHGLGGQFDYARLAQAMTHVRLAATISATSLDEAIGMGLR